MCLVMQHESLIRNWYELILMEVDLDDNEWFKRQFEKWYVRLGYLRKKNFQTAKSIKNWNQILFVIKKKSFTRKNNHSKKHIKTSAQMCVRIRRTVSCGHNFKKPIRTYKTREDRIPKKRIKMKNKTGMTENRVRRRRFDKQLFSRVRLLQKVENVHVRDRGWGLEIKMSNSEIHMPNKKKKPVNKRRMRNCAVTETCETIVQLQFVSLHLDKATMIVLDRRVQFFFLKRKSMKFYCASWSNYF